MVNFQQQQWLSLQDVAGTHQVMMEFRAYPTGDGFMFERTIILDGGFRKVMEAKVFTREDIANEFEVAHHVLHGRPPQGLDPREGPTRLHPGPGR